MISRATIAESSTRTNSATAAIYCRVSSTGQEENYSLPTQEAECHTYAAEQGYQVAEVYREVHSGAEMWERPQLTRLRESIKRQEIGALICYALDRLSRSQAHLAIIAEECDRAGVALLFATEVFERSPVGEFMRSAKAFVAEMEREKIRERTMRGRLARVNAGKLTGYGPPLFGYRWRDDTKAAYEIDPATSLVIKRIFDMALGGQTITRIGRILTAEGLPTPRGQHPWRAGAVQRMLTNPAYTGEAHALRWRTVKSEAGLPLHRLRDEADQVAMPIGTVPAIIDRQTFDAVQAQLRRNGEESIRNSHSPERHLLRCGFIVCGYCGRRAHGSYSKSRPTSPVRNIYLTGMCRPCEYGCGNSTNIRADSLDHAVWKRVEAILRRPEMIAEEIQRLRSTDDHGADIAAARRARDEIARRQANASRRITMIDDDEAAAPLIAEVRALSRQKQQLESEIAGLVALQERWEATQAQITNVLAWCRSFGANLGDLTYQQKRDVLTWLGVKVKLYKRDHTPRYEITANIPLDINEVPLEQFATHTRTRMCSNSPHVVLRWTDTDGEDEAA